MLVVDVLDICFRKQSELTHGPVSSESECMLSFLNIKMTEQNIITQLATVKIKLHKQNLTKSGFPLTSCSYEALTTASTKFSK